MAWPSTSPDFTLMDFFHIQALMYTSPVDSEEYFIARIVEAVRLNICSKFVRNTTSFSAYFSGCA